MFTGVKSLIAAPHEYSLANVSPSNGGPHYLSVIYNKKKRRCPVPVLVLLLITWKR